MADVKLEGMEELLTEMNKLGEAGEKIEKTVLVKAGKKVQEVILRRKVTTIILYLSIGMLTSQR